MGLRLIVWRPLMILHTITNDFVQPEPRIAFMRYHIPASELLPHSIIEELFLSFFSETHPLCRCGLFENESEERERGTFDSAKNHKRQSVTAKREKSQTPKFV